ASCLRNSMARSWREMLSARSSAWRYSRPCACGQDSRSTSTASDWREPPSARAASSATWSAAARNWRTKGRAARRSRARRDSSTCPVTAGSAAPARAFRRSRRAKSSARIFARGAGGIGAHGGGWFGEGVDHVAQHLFARQVRAGGEGQQADAAQGTGGILLAAPYGLHLNVDGAAQEGGRLAMAEILERPGDGVLAPTLRIAFDGVFEETVEGAQQVWEDFGGGQVGGDVGGFGGDQVDAVGERLAQGGGGVGGGSSAQTAEGFELFFNPAVGHE